MTDNGEWQTMINDRYWEMRDIRNDIKYEMTDIAEWQTMENYRQWKMLNNGE